MPPAARSLAAGKAMSRFLLVLYGVWICGWKGFLLVVFKKAKPDALTILDDNCGFTDPALVWDTEGSFGHRATDFIVEWVKKRAQRAAKLGGFVIVSLACLLVIELLVIAALIWRPWT